MAASTTTAMQIPAETALPSQPPLDTFTPELQGMKKYGMYYTTSRLNVRLHDADSPSSSATYYMRSSCTKGRLHLELRKGDTKTSPMVAFSRIRNTSRHMMIGKGDLQHIAEEQIAWEELRRDKNPFRRSDYQFSTEQGNEYGKRVEFYWLKDMEHSARTIYDCTDAEGKVVARLLSGGAFNWKKGGEIDVVQGLDPGLEEMLIMSAIDIWTFEAFAYQSLLQGYDKKDKKG